jgi:hypothetical protein
VAARAGCWFGVLLLFVAHPLTHARAYRVYYGNLHAHTSVSDGVGTPAQAFAYARDVAAIDVQALTEHSNATSYSMTPEQYDSLRVTADACTQDGVFVALAGQETGSLGSDGFGHINIFEAPGLDPVNRGDLIGNYAWILSQDVPAQFNHPFSSSSSRNSIFNSLWFYPAYDQAMSLIEVLNGSYSYESQYIQALTQGWHVGAAGNQDNHEADWGNRVNSRGDIPLTGILADRLTKPDILDALDNRRTFAAEISPATDRIGLELEVDGHEMGERFSVVRGEVSIRVSVSASTGFRRLDLYRDGVIHRSLEVGSPITCTWELQDTIAGGSHYYFLRATQNDGDRAWSSPVWVAFNSYSPNGALIYCRPNPIREQGAEIVYRLGSGTEPVTLRVFNAAGDRVWDKTISQPTGIEPWDAVNSYGHRLAAGVYAMLLEQGGRRSWGKVAVLR